MLNAPAKYIQKYWLIRLLFNAIDNVSIYGTSEKRETNYKKSKLANL